MNEDCLEIERERSEGFVEGEQKRKRLRVLIVERERREGAE